MLGIMSIEIALESFLDGDVTKQISNDSNESKVIRLETSSGRFLLPSTISYTETRKVGKCCLLHDNLMNLFYKTPRITHLCALILFYV